MTSFNSEALSDNEKDAMDKLFEMMLSLRQQIILRRLSENGSNQAQ